jgi:PhnB protein
MSKKLADLLTIIYGIKVLRRVDHENGKIAHIELQLDDSIILISDSTESYEANQTMLHI